MKITRYHEDLTNLHINTLPPRAYFIPYASLGCAFAYMYYDTDSVFAPMLAHLFHNTVLIIFSII